MRSLSGSLESCEPSPTRLERSLERALLAAQAEIRADESDEGGAHGAHEEIRLAGAHPHRLEQHGTEHGDQRRRDLSRATAPPAFADQRGHRGGGEQMQQGEAM